MSSFTAILPGARVRTAEGFLGTVERLARTDVASDGQADSMVVRSDDGQWRYSLPLMLVVDVKHQTFNTLVTINLNRDQLPQYVVERIAGSERRTTTTTTQPTTASEEPVLRVPVAEETLIVQKHPAQIGTIHIHKGVEVEERHVTVPVYHEEALIERIPADQYEGSGVDNPNETIIPIIEERLVVQKQSVIVEYVRVRKRLVEEKQEIVHALRREVVHVTEHRLDGQQRNVEATTESMGLAHDHTTNQMTDDNGAADAEHTPQ